MKFLGKIDRNEIFGVEKIVLGLAGIYPNEKFPSWKLYVSAAAISFMWMFQVYFRTHMDGHDNF